MNRDLRPSRGTGPLRVVVFGDGPRPFKIMEELVYGVQDDRAFNAREHLGAGATRIMTHNYFEPVGWVGDYSLPPKGGDVRCTRFGPLPNTTPMPQMLLGDIRQDCPNLNVTRWQQPIVERSNGRKVLRKDFLHWFKSLKPDICLMSTFATLIPMELIQMVQGWFINFHPTRMNCTWPEFGGCTPWEDMFWARVHTAVVAAYFIDDKFDRGQFITESETRARVRVRSVDVNGQLLPPTQRDARPKLLDEELRALFRDPTIRKKVDPMPGYTVRQQRQYVFDNHILMAEPTANLVHSLARIIWHVRRREIIPEDMTTLYYFQNLFPKQIVIH